MHFFLLIFFLVSSLISSGQKIECRSDSLFINHTYVNNLTGKPTFDNLFGQKGKERRRPGKGKSSSVNIITSYVYKKLGLIVSKNSDDTSRLSIAIKLYKNNNPIVDQSNMETGVFKGDLFIADNYINDKRSIEELQKLRYCTLTYQQTYFATSDKPVVILANIKYQSKSFRLLFDSSTNQLTCVFIY